MSSRKPNAPRAAIALSMWFLTIGFSTSPAYSTIFTGPAVQGPTTVLQGGNFDTWDFSQLALVDTPNGMKFTGIATGQITHHQFFGVGVVVGGFTLSAQRAILGSYSGQDITVLAAISATISTTGDVVVYQVGTAANSSCGGVSAIVDAFPGSVPNNVSDGPNTVQCTLGDSGGGNHAFTHQTDVLYWFPAGASLDTATITINFGSSALSEARLTNAEAVPEPSTALLTLAGLGGLSIYRRKRRDTRAG